jgi:hypothetical protein
VKFLTLHSVKPVTPAVFSTELKLFRIIAGLPAKLPRRGNIVGRIAADQGQSAVDVDRESASESKPISLRLFGCMTQLGRLRAKG